MKKKVDLGPLLAELAELKLAETRLAGRKKEVSKKIMDALIVNKVKSSSVDFGNGATFRATLTQGSTTVIDEDRLKKRLGSKVWKTVTRTVLDRKLLEEKVAMQAISKVDVADCATVTPNEPYLRTSGTFDENDIAQYHKKK